MKTAKLIICGLMLVVAPLTIQGQVVEEENGERVQGRADSAGEQTLDLADVAERIVRGTNEFRAEQDRRPVEVDPDLKKTAQYFADYMARTDKYGHTADGNRPAQRAKEHKYEYCIVSENIAYAYRSTGFTEEKLAQQFVEGWINSPEHRKNMVDADVTETGVAAAHSEQSGNYYAVQMFGRPKSMSIAFTVANQSDAEIEYEIGEQVFPLPPRYTRTHEQCRPSQVKFPLSGGQGDKAKTKTVQPESGDRFVVKREGGQFQVEEAK